MLLFALFIHFISPAFGQSLMINEFVASNNSGLQDEDGDFSDWIEIYNSGDAEDTLSGWYLTDNEELLTKWAFPEVIIEAHGYLVVFASGKDRKENTDSLHTNFKLSASGEFLALVKPGGIEPATAFQPEFPPQYEDVSYGLLSGEYVFLSEPSPGAENNGIPYLTPPVFSIAHGYFYSPVTLELSSDIEGTDIYYTRDASTPSVANGTKYTMPINISETTILRAVNINGGVSSQSVTQSYLFPEDIIRQPEYPEGYPEEWLQPVDGTDEHIPIASDYGMHQSVVDHPEASPVILESLLDLPVVSLVSDIDNFFSKSTHPDTGGIYMYTGAPDGPTRYLRYHLGHDWIRPASVEYFNSKDVNTDFQVNCGIKIHGGATRTPWKTAKHSFKLGFKSEYGPGQLRQNIFGAGTPGQFDWLVLRGGFALRYGQQIYDPWMKSTFRDMDQYAAYSQFVHVYLNGMYWGIYNLCERMDDNCMADHFGGEPEEYDIVKDYYEVGSGDTIAWAELVNRVQDSIADPAKYQSLLGNNPDGTPNPELEKMVDVRNLADYMLMNFYAGNTDWDHHNWVAARRKVNSEGFRFIPWDGEYILQSAYDNVVQVNNENRPTGIFHDLMENEEFRNLFYSRVSEHFFEDGALTPQPGYKRYVNWRAIIDTAILCESARWNSEEQPKSDIWENSYHNFINSYFPVRTEIVLNQLIQKNMYPLIAPPEFNTENKYIPEDFQLFMSSPSGGDIRYTFNGTDPGFYTPGTIEGLFIYDGSPLPFVSDTITIRARVINENMWSKLVTRQFIIGEDPSITIPSMTASRTTTFQVFPNPAREGINIKYTLSQNSTIRLCLYTLTGEQIASLNEGLNQAGEHHIYWPAGDLPPGVYLCVLENLSEGRHYLLRVIVE